jgi:hypothetical protein
VDETVSRFWTELLSRPSGPLAFRFILQPAIAMIYAIRDGRRDAKHHRPAYFWALFTSGSGQRRSLLKSGWKSIGKVAVVALIIDLIYQFIVLHGLRPIEAVTIVIILAILPYLLLRGPVNRLLN